MSNSSTTNSTGADKRCGLITFGETMGLLTALDIGPLEMARQFRYGIGGAESNVAIGVTRLGQRATWFGRVGPDATGELIVSRLRAEGVNTLAIGDRRPTGVMIKHSRFAHVQRLDYHRHHSAAAGLTPADIQHDALRQARILHVTGITPALSTSASATVFAAIDEARDCGVAVSVDVNYRRKLWEPELAAPVLRRLVERADIVFAGPDEARLVLGDETPAPDIVLAGALNALGSRETIIKAGSRGCSAVIDGQTYSRAALSVDAIDTVGAGDAFVAGYLCEWLNDSDPHNRLATAVHVGALAVSVPGDCEGLPTQADLHRPLHSDDIQR